jgi:serine/threonine protein kinase
MQDHDHIATAPPTGPHIEGGSDALPERIGRYRVEKVLGEGGFGRVFLAHDDQLSRPVAARAQRTMVMLDGEAETLDAGKKTANANSAFRRRHVRRVARPQEGRPHPLTSSVLQPGRGPGMSAGAHQT